MFEVVLSTMESKLRRVENLDRAVQHLMRKMDSIEDKIEKKSDEILNKIDNMGQNLNSKISTMGNSDSVLANINSRLDQMSSKIDAISSTPKETKPIKRHINVNENEHIDDSKDSNEELFIAQPSNRKSKYVNYKIYKTDIKNYWLKYLWEKINFF